MKFIVLFQQGNASFRFVPDGKFIEVLGADGLGVPTWLPAKGGHPCTEILLSKALARAGNALSTRMHGEAPDDGGIKIVKDHPTHYFMTIDLGRLG